MLMFLDTTTVHSPTLVDRPKTILDDLVHHSSTNRQEPIHARICIPVVCNQTYERSQHTCSAPSTCAFQASLSKTSWTYSSHRHDCIWVSTDQLQPCSATDQRCVQERGGSTCAPSAVTGQDDEQATQDKENLVKRKTRLGEH